MAEKKTAAKPAKKPAAKAAKPVAAKAAPKKVAAAPKAVAAKKVSAPKVVTEKPVAVKAVKGGKSNLPKTLKVTQTGSKSGATVRQIKSLVGLGLGKIGRVKMLEDTLSVRGLIAKVQHLVKVETTK